MLPNEAKADSFTEFFLDVEPRLRRALTAMLGSEVGREATSEALVYGWEHWDRLKTMYNPAGYLYRVGRRRGRRMQLRRRPETGSMDAVGEPWFEPGLPEALARLPERQRLVVSLLHGHGWTMTEVADLLEIGKSTVQSYEQRAMSKLRRMLGVDS